MIKDDRTKCIITSCIDTFKRGNYTIPECLQQIENEIQRETWCIYDIDEKIKRQNKLYKYGLSMLHNAIGQMDRLSN